MKIKRSGCRKKKGDKSSLGSWIGAKAGARKMIKKAGRLWRSAKKLLKRSRLLKRWQEIIVEACAKSTRSLHTLPLSFLCDCQARTWHEKDVKRLQKWITDIDMCGVIGMVSR